MAARDHFAVAIAAIGQLIHHYYKGDEASSKMISAAVDDGAEEAAHAAHHETLKWYLSTFALLTIPFIYMRVPEIIVGTSEPGHTGLHSPRHRRRDPGASWFISFATTACAWR